MAIWSRRGFFTQQTGNYGYDMLFGGVRLDYVWDLWIGIETHTNIEYRQA